jgi:hypothetical protein
LELDYGGEWMDLYEYECVAPLKVFTKDVPEVSSNVVKNSDYTLNVTTNVKNVHSKGTVYYLINGKKVLDNGQNVITTINKDSTISKKIKEGIYSNEYVLTVVYSSENYEIKQNFTIKNNLNKTSIKINKASTTVKAPKVTGKFKKSKYFKVTIKNKETKKLLSNVKVKIKVFTGKKYKTYSVKTNKKGIAKINTKKLKIGNHKVIISSGNKNYSISGKSLIKIKK